MDDLSHLHFADRVQFIETKLGTEAWITVYEYTETDQEKIAHFSALTTVDDVERSLSQTQWDLLIGNGGPGFCFYGGGDWKYLPTGGDEAPIEALVHVRDFHGLRPDYMEISEQFRLFFNLYDDRKSGKLVAFEENGDEVEVVRSSPKKIQILAKYLRDYLAAREMVLLIFCEIDRWNVKDLEELGIEEAAEEDRKEDLTYSWWVSSKTPVGDKKTYARMIAKKVVHGTPGYRPSSLWGREDREYEQFTIGVDDAGRRVMFTCDEEELANHFGKNAGAPHYLTPVFFRKSVLNKYYSDPKYSVRDGILFCGGFWSLRMDNNHTDYVIVFLGDLGHLAHAEQLYWKSFNVAPDGDLSDVAFRRGMLGEWADAEEPALVFKSTYQRFREKWSQVNGWDLFKDLASEDHHFWQALHVPGDGNQREFDDQIMALSKVMVERLNDRGVSKFITLEPNDKSIAKLEKYLEYIGYPGRVEFGTFLRYLNGLRSGPAHVKGDSYRKAAVHFRVDEMGMSGAFGAMLNSASIHLSRLLEFAAPETSAGQAGS
ncbi:hypothetical protein ACFRKE_09675 [Kitasatospora indigofera]|uniref:hypothetical protein n=1 Tax=Kitasatospora indigofera TaxID=67307 RepID=UPI0036B2B9E9